MKIIRNGTVRHTEPAGTSTTHEEDPYSISSSPPTAVDLSATSKMSGENDEYDLTHSSPLELNPVTTCRHQPLQPGLPEDTVEATEADYKGPPYLQQIPYEIRHLILRHFLIAKQQPLVRRPFQGLDVRIMYVCRQLYEDGKLMLYRDKILHIEAKSSNLCSKDQVWELDLQILDLVVVFPIRSKVLWSDKADILDLINTAEIVGTHGTCFALLKDRPAEGVCFTRAWPIPSTTVLDVSSAEDVWKYAQPQAGRFRHVSLSIHCEDEEALPQIIRILRSVVQHSNLVLRISVSNRGDLPEFAENPFKWLHCLSVTRHPHSLFLPTTICEVMVDPKPDLADTLQQYFKVVELMAVDPGAGLFTEWETRALDDGEDPIDRQCWSLLGRITGGTRSRDPRMEDFRRATSH